MRILIKLAGEIGIKSKQVRKRYIARLKRNIEQGLKNIGNCQVISEWDLLTVTCKNPDEVQKLSVIQKLQKISGIHSFSIIDEFLFQNFEDTLEKVAAVYVSLIEGKSFVVRVKRVGIHSFSSLDLERFLGGGLLRRANNAKVKLENPDVTVMIEIRDKDLYIVKEKISGIGGFPLGTQSRVLSLISGGFDSGVASYLMMRKGCEVDFLFFNLGGKSHEIGVKQMVYQIANEYSSGYTPVLFTVPFEPIVKELLTKVTSHYRGVLLKRMMFRVADIVAQEYGYAGVVTGESMGQVSSQTAINLNVISQVADTVIHRPLIAYDKEDIIQISRKIGTEYIAAHMPEYCGVVSEKPSTAASLKRVLDEEKSFDLNLIDEVFEAREKTGALKVEHSEDEILDMEIVAFIQDETVIDIRDDEQRKKEPLKIAASVLEIPFYDLQKCFKDFDPQKKYLLYCEKGIVSSTHALALREQGFSNVKVYRPLEGGACLV